ncbi:MAG: phage tail sheath C-terminal domain-containing protein [Rhodocyclaceae bacterium]
MPKSKRPSLHSWATRSSRVASFDGDLVGTPTRIKSLLEYEALYGYGPAIAVTEVVLDDNNNFVSSAISSNFYFYDSLRLFFDNGGGDCYIVSVKANNYATQPDRDELIAGVKAVKKFDEPTILLFPDAAGLDADKLSAVQKEALKQCGELGDRVAVLDTIRTDALGSAFRDKIGINSLKYGAAYTPWLKLNYSKNVGYANIKNALKKGGSSVTLQSLTSDAGLLALMKTIDDAQADITGFAARINTATGAIGKSISAQQAELMNTYRSTPTAANMQNLFGYLYRMAELVDGGVIAGTPFVHGKLKDDAAASITSTLKTAYTNLIAFEKELSARMAAAPAPGPFAYTVQWDVGSDPSAAEWGGIFGGSSPAASTTGIAAALDEELELLNAALPFINAAFSAVSGVISSLVSAASSYRSTAEQALLENFGVYANLIKGINNTLTSCPPSGAIAGIYSLVDNQRGVWKAPANVSLNSVIGPEVNFDTSDTDGLNVDTVAGKSINAIRAFAGKGTLIWGARTLAGNDNEWRYVSVRRFFNMVEESVKKLTYWAVFEPNDANTWVKVRGMIENYLTQKWREGALAGAAPKDAFFVRCGLGVTMNAQDILEGRMIVQIGMAVVRPAEFIILQFSHKLQTS